MVSLYRRRRVVDETTVHRHDSVSLKLIDGERERERDIEREREREREREIERERETEIVRAVCPPDFPQGGRS